MATALVSAVVNLAGKTIYRQAGRFISKAVYLREIRRATGIGGRFVSAAQHARGLTKGGIADLLMNTVGPPIGGGDWVSRVRQSQSRFAELLGDNNQLG